MGAEKNRVDSTAGRLHGGMHLRMDIAQCFQIKQTTADAGLISGDNDLIASIEEPGNRFKAAGDGYPLVGRLYVSGAVMIDDAVTIKDK